MKIESLQRGPTTLRQMKQIPHTEIDDSFKSELLGPQAARTPPPPFFCVHLSARRLSV